MKRDEKPSLALVVVVVVLRGPQALAHLGSHRQPHRCELPPCTFSPDSTDPHPLPPLSQQASTGSHPRPTQGSSPTRPSSASPAPAAPARPCSCPHPQARRPRPLPGPAARPLPGPARLPPRTRCRRPLRTRRLPQGHRGASLSCTPSPSSSASPLTPEPRRAGVQARGRRPRTREGPRSRSRARPGSPAAHRQVRPVPCPLGKLPR